MTQSIVVQVGQCGNQIGCRFWDLALREYVHVNKKGVYDESVSSFFRNVDARSEAGLPVGDKIRDLKARAVLVDMEEGVVGELLKGPLSDVFDCKQLITDVSGCGNNWAVGHHVYGDQYKEQISDALRRAAEMCDCLQCFFVLHSMGGGTGSGVGTFVLQLLRDEYTDVFRFVSAVYPSADDDVITSPYNSVLAMNELTENADCVLPFENQALVDLVAKIHNALPQARPGQTQPATIMSSDGGATTKNDQKPFDTMNNIVANALLNLTSSARFEGSLNVDLNEIATNLVPFPRLHYLVSSQTPVYASADLHLPARKLDSMFTDAFSQDNQMMKADPKHSVYLACALLVRGAGVHISDLRRNIDRLKPSLKFVPWNEDGWKTGLCNVAPAGQPYSLLTLANNTCVRHTFSELKDRFYRLYKRKAHMHHYTQVQGMDQAQFTQAYESLTSVVNEYRNLENSVIHG